MIINLIKEHDLTRGPEAHQVHIFTLQGETPGEAHFPSVFEHKGVKYRSFASHRQMSPVKIEGKMHAIACVKAVKLEDEQKWAKEGRRGKINAVQTGHFG